MSNVADKPASVSDAQPAPIPNEQRPVWDIVIEDMRERDHVGRERYGTPLQTFNGRDPMVDAYQEALDLTVYLRQGMIERDAMKAEIEAWRSTFRAYDIMANKRPLDAAAVDAAGDLYDMLRALLPASD